LIRLWRVLMGRRGRSAVLALRRLWVAVLGLPALRGLRLSVTLRLLVPWVVPRLLALSRVVLRVIGAVVLHSRPSEALTAGVLASKALSTDTLTVGALSAKPLSATLR
jgi:hypothetical protein